jgi:chromate transporter
LLLVYAAARFWRRLESAPWRRTAESALAPVAVGLVFASGLSLLQGTESGWLLWGITLCSTLVLTLTGWHPVVMLAAGGAIALLANM